MAATQTAFAGSTIVDANGQSYNDIQLRSYRNTNDSGYTAMTTPSADWGYCSLTASATTTVKTGAGQLHALICGTATGNVSIYDGTAAAGNTIQATCALAVGTTTFDVSFGTSLVIVLSGAGVAMVAFR